MSPAPRVVDGTTDETMFLHAFTETVARFGS